MTYSIVARDATTGELGVAVQTRWPNVGETVPWAEPGVGAVATQSFTEKSYDVPPWQVGLSIAILVVSIAVVAVVAVRMYAAGVLLYGQRPSIRAFVAAARRA